MTIPTEKLQGYKQEAKDAGGKGWAWTCMVLCDELIALNSQVSRLEDERDAMITLKKEWVKRAFDGADQVAIAKTWLVELQDLRTKVSRLEDEVLVRKAGFIYHRPGEWQPPLDSSIHSGMRFGLGAAVKLARSM